MDRLMYFFRRSLWYLITFWYALLRKRTIGARGLVIKDDQILLITHTYQKGWCTIGGGVNRGESPLQAAVRELYEEAGVIVQGKPELFGVYHNTKDYRDDYVTLYVIKDFLIEDVKSSEIAEKRWFPLSQLPEDTTPATRRRIEEYLNLISQSDKW